DLVTGVQTCALPISGILRGPESLTSDLVSYSLSSETFEKLSNFGTRPNWMNDSRRLIFSKDDKIYLLDGQTKKAREIFSVAPNQIGRASCRDEKRVV